MITGATPSYLPSVPPTCGWRRVVELADEYKVSTADMLAICDRLGVTVEDASEWIDTDAVGRIRDIIAVGGPAAVLRTDRDRTVGSPPRRSHRKAPPELGSVSRDGVRTRRVLLIGFAIALFAGATGVVVERWVANGTTTDAPATVVTIEEG